MPKVRVAGYGVSLDGFGAGLGQSLQEPLGKGGGGMFQWFFATQTFRTMHGLAAGEAGHAVDEAFARRAMDGNGAWVLGRNMFGPIRGPWPDEEWKGWWGDEPPYHVPTFVLTHHPRAPIVMKGGTTFYFVTDGIQSALAQAKAAAGDRDVRIGGGVATVRQYLEADLIDEMHLAVSPVLVGSGEALIAGIDLAARGFVVAEHAASTLATHVVLTRHAA